MGINVNRIYLLTFGLGTAITGVASVFLTPIYTLSPTIGGDFVLAAFAVVVLGGMGSVWGAYFAGLIIGVIEAAAGFYIDPALKSAVWFLIFIIVLIVRPAGLLGTIGAEEVGLREQH
jgi:branched-chain amino acid transport system permease protein